MDKIEALEDGSDAFIDSNNGIYTENAEVELELTSAEKEILLSKKRDKFYRSSLYATTVFFVLAMALIVGFKVNEGFFDANNRLALLMEEANSRMENASYPKINVKATFKDEKSSKLVIPIGFPIKSDLIEVTEEFIDNKLVITLRNASDIIGDGIEIISDSSIMDAVGIYRQNTDIVIEVYGKEMYAWSFENKVNAITFNFADLNSVYEHVAVVYVPHEDKVRLTIEEWQQKLSAFSEKKNVKLFLAYNMQEIYTEKEVIQFANNIKADAIIGIKVGVDKQLEQTSALTVYNDTYFISGFGSPQMAIILAEAFAGNTKIAPTGFRKSNDKDILVSQARIPVAFTEITQTEKDSYNTETVFKMNESIIQVIESAIDTAIDLKREIKPDSDMALDEIATER